MTQPSKEKKTVITKKTIKSKDMPELSDRQMYEVG